MHRIWGILLCAPHIILPYAPLPLPSEPAKDCVRRMLQRDPKRRSTASQILLHDWMKENGVASDKPIEMEVVTRIKKFSAGNRLKKEAIKVWRQGGKCGLNVGLGAQGCKAASGIS